jgi:hypothetical protein
MGPIRAAITLTGLLVVGGGLQAEAGGSKSPAPCAAAAMVPEHIRTSNCQMANAIVVGIARSATFRRMIERVRAFNGIVFLTATPVVQASANRVLQGTLQHRVTVAGPYRLLYVTVAPGSATHATVTFAHELQHAVEVLESGATTERAIDQLLERIGAKTGAGVSETAAAVAAERAVTKELSGTR